MKVYKSKVDWWLIIVLAGISIYLLNLIYLHFTIQTLHEDPLFFVFLGFLALIVWSPIPTTYYVIDNDVLKVQSIFLKWEIPLRNIYKVERTYNPLSAPALSLDRLRIEYTTNGISESIMVSPKEQEQFIKEIL